jgi:hypothetical protein
MKEFIALPARFVLCISYWTINIHGIWANHQFTALYRRRWFRTLFGSRDLFQPRNCKLWLFNSSPWSCWYCYSEQSYWHTQRIIQGM